LVICKSPKFGEGFFFYRFLKAGNGSSLILKTETRGSFISGGFKRKSDNPNLTNWNQRFFDFQRL
jgi:hypothetical protein